MIVLGVQTGTKFLPTRLDQFGIYSCPYRLRRVWCEYDFREGELRFWTQCQYIGNHLSTSADLVCSQKYHSSSLIRVGTIYSPMVIVVSIFSGWIIFIVKKFTLVNCGMPPKRIYNSFAQNIFFLLFLLLTLILMAFPVFFSLTRSVIFQLLMVNFERQNTTLMRPLWQRCASLRTGQTIECCVSNNSSGYRKPRNSSPA